MEDDAGGTEVEALEMRLTKAGAPYALERGEGKCGDVKRFSYGPKHLGAIFQKARSRGDKVFVVTESEAVTYEQVFGQATALASALVERFGIGVSDRVALAIDNRAEWIISFFGIIAAGGSVVLLTDYGAEFLRSSLGLVNCKLAIADTGKIQALREAGYCGPAVSLGGNIEVDRIPEFEARFEELVTESKFALLPSISSDREALVSFTSGSTGKPKAVVLSHDGIVTGLMNMMLSGTLAHASRKRVPGAAALPLCPLIRTPLAYIGGYSQVLLTAMFGGKFALLENWGTQRALKFVRRENITSITGLDTKSSFELLRADEAADMLASIRSWNISGVALRESLVQAIFQKLPGVFISTGYGLTETNGGVCSIAWDAAQDIPGSVGRLVPTVDIRIVDDKGNNVQDGVAGDIWLRGPMLMLGYLSEEGQLTGLDDNWFPTGDVGHVSTSRHLYLLDRRSEVVSFDGYSFSTGDVERFLTSMPGIEDACMVMLEIEEGENRLVVALLPEPVAEIDVANIAEKLIAKFQLASITPLLFCCDELPRTLSGKISRREIKSLARSRVGAPYRDPCERVAL